MLELLGTETRIAMHMWLHASVSFGAAENREACHICPMCGRVVQVSGPLRYAMVDGLNVRDTRLDNYPRRYNGTPGQELLVIRRNQKTGETTLEPVR